jgi:hypothetical protein
MKKFNDFKGKSLSQNDLRKLYGGDCKTGDDHCPDNSDNNGKTTYDDGCTSDGDKCPTRAAIISTSITFEGSGY